QVILLFTIQNYMQKIKNNLERNSEELIRQLRKTICFKYYNKVDLLDYTAFIQPHEISIMMYSMDRQANEVFYQGDEKNIFAGSYYVIEDIRYFNVSD